MTPVELGHIEEKLGQIWQEKNQTGQIKACLFNLVIYAQEERRAEYLHDIAHSILEKFPCRIIFIQHREGDPDRLDVSVTNEVTTKGNRTIACDELELNVGKDRLNRVPFMVIPHLVPDLPIYLLWGQDPTSDREVLPSLESYASKLIFDSECSANLREFAKEMLTLMDTSKVDVMDLNWAAISGWRDALARVFDHEEAINNLRAIPTLRILYNKKQTQFVRSHDTKAIYFQAWLASRFNWKLKSTALEGAERIIHYTHPSGETKVVLVPDEEAQLPAGELVGVEAIGEGCEYTFMRRSHHPKLLVHATCNDRCELPFTLPIPDIKHRSVFLQEIFFQSINDHYRAMLKAIASYTWEN